MFFIVYLTDEDFLCMTNRPNSWRKESYFMFLHGIYYLFIDRIFIVSHLLRYGILVFIISRLIRLPVIAVLIKNKVYLPKTSFENF